MLHRLLFDGADDMLDIGRAVGIVDVDADHRRNLVGRGMDGALFARRDIAHDAGIAETPRSPTEFTIGHNVRSESEVDQVMRQALAAGARLVKPAQKTFWGGYAGQFQDPDDHLWEIVYNPVMLPED